MSDLALALQHVQQQISEACAKVGRKPDSVRLLAVSKTFPAAAIREAHAAGQTCFGENYVQELLEKCGQLQDLPLEWHFIGPLQSNKTRAVAEHAHWVHSVDRLKIAERLSAQRPAALPALNLCIQVNVSGEASKSGCQPEEVLPLAQAISRLPGVRLRGLMCIPEPSEDAAILAARFGLLQQLQQQLHDQDIVTDTLSMGMSADLAAAIAAGSTMVRVGSAIFGKRHYAV